MPVPEPPLLGLRGRTDERRRHAHRHRYPNGRGEDLHEPGRHRLCADPGHDGVCRLSVNKPKGDVTMKPTELIPPAPRFFGTTLLCAALTLSAAASTASERRRVIEVDTVEAPLRCGQQRRQPRCDRSSGARRVLFSRPRQARAPDVPRPNHGALRLQPGMALVGSEERVDTNGDGVPDPISPETPDDLPCRGRRRPSTARRWISPSNSGRTARVNSGSFRIR